MYTEVKKNPFFLSYFKLSVVVLFVVKESHFDPLLLADIHEHIYYWLPSTFVLQFLSLIYIFSQYKMCQCVS